MSSDMRDTVGREGLRRTRTRSRLGFFAGTALALSTLLCAAGSNAAVMSDPISQGRDSVAMSQRPNCDGRRGYPTCIASRPTT